MDPPPVVNICSIAYLQVKNMPRPSIAMTSSQSSICALIAGVLPPRSHRFGLERQQLQQLSGSPVGSALGEHVRCNGDGGLLVASRVGPQHPEPGAVVDGGELVVLLASHALLAQGLDELDVDLQLVAGALLLVAFPPQRPPLVALRRRQPVHPKPLQDPPHPRGADRQVVVAARYIAILAGPKW